MPVYDTALGVVIGEVQDLPGVHGVLAVPEVGRVYASATGIAYDPELGKLYVSDESGGTDTVIDTAANQVVATIPLGGEVGNTQFVATAHRIIAAVQTRNQVVSSRWRLSPVGATPSWWSWTCRACR
jgi:YVTN family beta-propeller protein